MTLMLNQPFVCQHSMLCLTAEDTGTSDIKSINTTSQNDAYLQEEGIES